MPFNTTDIPKLDDGEKLALFENDSKARDEVQTRDAANHCDSEKFITESPLRPL